MSMDHTRPAPCVPLTAKDSVKRLHSFVQQTFIESLPRAGPCLQRVNTLVIELVVLW